MSYNGGGGVRLGALIAIQDPTTTRSDSRLEGVVRYIGQLGKSPKTLLPVAERLEIAFTIENIFSFTNFGSLSEHISSICNAFDHPNLGFYPDTGYALVVLSSVAH